MDKRGDLHWQQIVLAVIAIAILLVILGLVFKIGPLAGIFNKQTQTLNATATESNKGLNNFLTNDANNVKPSPGFEQAEKYKENEAKFKAALDEIITLLTKGSLTSAEKAKIIGFEYDNSGKTTLVMTKEQVGKFITLLSESTNDNALDIVVRYKSYGVLQKFAKEGICRKPTETELKDTSSRYCSGFTKYIDDTELKGIAYEKYIRTTPSAIIDITTYMTDVTKNPDLFNQGVLLLADFARDPSKYTLLTPSPLDRQRTYSRLVFVNIVYITSADKIPPNYLNTEPLVYFRNAISWYDVCKREEGCLNSPDGKKLAQNMLTSCNAVSSKAFNDKGVPPEKRDEFYSEALKECYQIFPPSNSSP